jgi:sarcosine oxidase subunit alpha
MAVVAGGLERKDQTLHVHAHGKVTPVKVSGSVFVDVKGDRQNV